MALSGTELAGYRERGYHWPLTAFGREEAERYRQAFLAYWRDNEQNLSALLPRDRRQLLTETHLFLRWVYELVSSPRVLDAVESVLGPDILVWNTHWFPKLARDPAYVSWHQDAAYWGLSPPHVTTAWIALTPSTPENGCLQVLPGSHATAMPQQETYGRDNMLSRGQTIAGIDESEAVALALEPGQFSLHHIGLAHGSGRNDSATARIGIAVRYLSPDVVQNARERDLVLLVRGRDRYGHFELADPPDRDHGYGDSPIHAEALARKTRNLIPQAQAAGRGVRE